MPELEHSNTKILEELGSTPLRSFVFSSGASLVVSFLILFAIVQAKKTPINEVEAPYEDLTAIFIPAPPPPPREEAEEEIPELPSEIQIETEPNQSEIQIPVATDMKMETAQPTLSPRLEFSIEAFQPGSQYERQRIPVYFISQVDQRPIPIYKKIPKIDEKLAVRVDITRIRLVYIVNKTGEVSQISLLHSDDPEFSRYILDAVKKWRFNPALKDGKKVNCWVRQAITVKPKKKNKFSSG